MATRLAPSDLTKQVPNRLLSSTILDDLLMIEFCVGNTTMLSLSVGSPGMKRFMPAGIPSRWNVVAQLRTNLLHEIQAHKNDAVRLSQLRKRYAHSARQASSLKRFDVSDIYMQHAQIVDHIAVVPKALTGPSSSE